MQNLLCNYSLILQFPNCLQQKYWNEISSLDPFGNAICKVDRDGNDLFGMTELSIYIRTILRSHSGSIENVLTDFEKKNLIHVNHHHHYIQYMIPTPWSKNRNFQMKTLEIIEVSAELHFQFYFRHFTSHKHSSVWTQKFSFQPTYTLMSNQFWILNIVLSIQIRKPGITFGETGSTTYLKNFTIRDILVEALLQNFPRSFRSTANNILKNGPHGTLAIFIWK